MNTEMDPKSENDDVNSEDHGSYTEGDYGTSGEERSEQSGGQEGQYIQGDYGHAGTESGITPPSDEHAGEGTGYVTTSDSDSNEPAAEPGHYTDTDAD